MAVTPILFLLPVRRQAVVAGQALLVAMLLQQQVETVVTEPLQQLMGRRFITLVGAVVRDLQPKALVGLVAVATQR